VTISHPVCNVLAPFAPSRSPSPAPDPCSLRAKVDTQIERYLVIKTAISAAQGSLVFVIMGYMLNVRMSHLFAAAHFVLNYIPTAGPISEWRCLRGVGGCCGETDAPSSNGLSAAAWPLPGLRSARPLGGTFHLHLGTLQPVPPHCLPLCSVLQSPPSCPCPS
jgi:hypothetical protein